MALIPLAEPEGLEGTPREVAESGIAQYGQALNTWKALMNKPDLWAAYLPFLRQVAGPGELDGVIKDLSALYVGHLNGCRYTASHRAASAGAKGVTADTMCDVVAGSWDGLDDRTRLALAVTRDMTLRPTEVAYAAEPQLLDAATRDALRAHFTDVEILELTMSISVWNALARFHRVMGFDLDMPEAPDGVNPA